MHQGPIAFAFLGGYKARRPYGEGDAVGAASRSSSLHGMNLVIDNGVHNGFCFRNKLLMIIKKVRKKIQI